MKILCCVSDKRYNFHIIGLRDVIRAAGYEFIEWDINEKPAFDIFDEIEPDFYLGPFPATSWIIKGRGSINKCLEERSSSIRWKYLHNIAQAADTINFLDGQVRDDYKSKVVYIGQYQPWIHNPILVVFKDTQFKVFGPANQWEIPNYLGEIALQNIKHIYASSTISLALDSTYQICQILIAGGLPIAKNLSTPFSKDSLLIAEDNQSYMNFLEAMTNNPDSRQKIIQEGREVIKNGHTYWHRVADLFTEWNLEDAAERVMNIYHETVKI